MEATSTACNNLSRNQICYGNVDITAELTDDAPAFEQQGDQIPLTDVTSLTLAPYEEGSPVWGVAVALAQAQLEDLLPGQGVTLLLFGDATISNDENGDLSAFTFRGGIGNAGCSEAPNGMLIQTSEGIAQVNLTINGVDITLGSTTFITAGESDDMLFALLEGDSTVGAAGETQTLVGGEFVTIPLDENLTPADVPSEPEPIIYGEDGIVLPSVVHVANRILPEAMPEIVINAAGLVGEDGLVIVGAGNVIQPLDGIWSGTPGEITASGGCPPGMAQMMSQQSIAGIVDNVDMTFPNPFNPAEMMTEDPGFVYGNPETNVYTYTWNQDGMNLNGSMTVTSETEMVTDVSMEMAEIGCTITMTWTMTRTGD